MNTRPLCFLIFGASGDLTKKKIFPALFRLHQNNRLGSELTVVGYARTNMDTDKFRELARSHIPVTQHWEDFSKHCFYIRGDYANGADYRRLYEFVQTRETLPNPIRIFYLSLPSSLFPVVASNLHKCFGGGPDHRLVLEKPFGLDLKTSNSMTREIGSLFSESQMYRMDHYLGKATVKNLLPLRFSNRILSSAWNRDHIDSVHITVKEMAGIEGRGGYFDNYGIIRDMIQNHLLQVLALVAMEEPASVHADHIRTKKVQVLSSTEAIAMRDVIVGQYRGYRQERDVSPDSSTPTYARIVLHIDNDRWKGVPFVLTCGKGLDEQRAVVEISFKPGSTKLFNQASSNKLTIEINSGTASLNLDPFILSAPVPASSSGPEAYDSLFLDVINRDQSCFVSKEELDVSWKIVTPILQAIENRPQLVRSYAFGSPGPSE